MAVPLLEMEGTWEEIAAAASARFNGERLRVIVLPAVDTETMPLETPRPIEEVLGEIGARVPPEEWARLPTDFSDQLDHYLYGTPKR